VSDFYDIDRANARLPELRETLLRLRELRGEVIALRDRIVELNAPWAIAGAGSSSSTPPGATQAEVEEETRMLRLRLQGMVDQMQAAVARIDGWGIQLRQIETGLVDFPALVSGRPIWLCWRLGEGEVAWWHEVTEGFDGRRKLEDLF
jgi:hypothetical protein